MTRISSGQRRTVLVDGALGAVLLAVCLASAPLLSSWAEERRAVDGLGYLLLVLACVPIVARRRYPGSVLAVVTAATSLYLVLAYPYGPIFGCLAVAVYTVGRHATTTRAVLAGAAALVVLCAHLFLGADPPGLFGVVPATAWIAIPLTIGIARRLVTESQARERAETERRKLDDERLRLATEVHDIVGHGLAAIQMQADIALHLADAKPDQGRTALQAISAASAAALSELRTTLGAITPQIDDGHDDGQGDTRDDGHDESRAPLPGLARIDELCRRTRRAGVAVELDVTGTPRRVSSDVDLAAYRIVQESLTNVLKHAHRRRATVRIGFGPARLTVTVTSPHDGSGIDEGFGIRGMRRRIEQLGGQLSVDAGMHLTVHALIPTSET